MDGNKLYKRRKELGLTLEEIGNIVGVSKSTVRKWETGYIENMKRDKIALLAKALQTTPLFIMGIEDEALPTIDHDQKHKKLSKSEQNLLDKYNSIDDKGKHTINTVLDMEYIRCNKSKKQITMMAAHNNETSNEQIELMKQDLEEL
jgi:transcriptional regulator with XRE-family HTH domain